MGRRNECRVDAAATVDGSVNMNAGDDVAAYCKLIFEVP